MRIATALALTTALGWTTAASAAGPLRATLDAEAAKLAVAQADDERDTGWRRVQQLAAGQDVIVRLHDGTPIRGKFVRADGSAVRINNPGDSRLVQRRDIYRIDMARGRGSAVGAAIGAGGGALAGVAFIARIDWYECGCGMGPGGAALIPIGAAIGLGVVGYRAFRQQPERIYLAP